MIIRLKHKHFLNILIICFLFICIFFPGDPYHLKLLFLGLIIIRECGLILKSIIKKRYLYVTIMGGLYPILLMIWSSVIGGNIGASISGAYSPFIFFLLIIVVERHIDYKKYFMGLLQLEVVSVCSIVALDALRIININFPNFITNAFYTFDMGLIGKNRGFAAYYKVFFKSSPLLIILIPYCFEKKKYFFAGLTLLAMLFSGTRGNIFAAAAVLLYECFVLWKFEKRVQAISLLISLGSIIIIALLSPLIIRRISGMMTAAGSVSSDSVRAGQLSSFLDTLRNPQNMILGMGFGSTFFDSGRNVFTGSSEIAYLDLIRKIGLIWSIPFFIFIFRPFGWKFRSDYKIAYLGYLVICFTNPLLFSSTAYVLYIFMYQFNYMKHDHMSKLLIPNALQNSQNSNRCFIEPKAESCMLER